MTAITIADLTNAKLDVDHIAEIATSSSNTSTDRLGNVKSTVSSAIDAIKAFNSRGAWVTATAYAIKDVVQVSGTWYACVVAHTSSAAFATDSASKWRVHQGLSSSELSVLAGAGLSGFSLAEFYPPNTVGAKGRQSASMVDAPFNAAGTGLASDQVAFDAAMASGYQSILLNDNMKFLVTSMSNNYGVGLDGNGAIVKAITGGLQKLNSYADRDKYVFGQEYMAAFHNLLIGQHTTPGRKPIMVFSGDSTTFGADCSADYRLDAYMKTVGEERGLQTPYGLSSVNRGISGAHTGEWASTYVTADLAATPDLLVLRWGINDPGYLQDGSTPPLDAGQSYPNRRNVANFITSLRAGLTTLRASRALANLSIVLMTPNATADTPNGRDEIWYESIVPGIKQAARDFQCTFIDTYGYLRDSRPAAGAWMDNPFADGRGIHPLNVMNTWICDLMADVVFPTGLADKLGRANMRSIAGAEDVGDGSRLPSYYKHGITMGRAVTNFPLSGIAITFRGQDQIVFQVNSPFANADLARVAIRSGRAATLGGEVEAWGGWIYLGTAAAAIVPATGFTATTCRAAANGVTVNIDGYVVNTTPAIIAAGTNIASVPVGFRPTVDSFYGVATAWDGTDFESVPVRVTGGGDITLMKATTLVASRVWICVSFSAAP